MLSCWVVHCCFRSCSSPKSRARRISMKQKHRGSVCYFVIGVTCFLCEMFSNILDILMAYVKWLQSWMTCICSQNLGQFTHNTFQFLNMKCHHSERVFHHIEIYKRHIFCIQKLLKISDMYEFDELKIKLDLLQSFSTSVVFNGYKC